jgi:hypothetical protein
MKQEEFVSLYDFLGRAAGPQLGKEVYRAAQLSSQPTIIKQVSNPTYTGKIVMYKPEFLRKYFNGLPTTIEPTKTTNDESLPF